MRYTAPQEHPFAVTGPQSSRGAFPATLAGGCGTQRGGKDLAGTLPVEVRARHGAGVSEKAPLHGSLASMVKGREGGTQSRGERGGVVFGENYVNFVSDSRRHYLRNRAVYRVERDARTAVGDNST